MKIPFTVEQFFDVFETYNQAIWPAQIGVYVLGLMIVAALLKPIDYSDQFISGVLALFWIWTGAFYHILHFSTINALALIFGVFFVLQGVALFFSGVWLNRLTFEITMSTRAIVGAVFVVFAMLLYPLIGSALGHHYPRTPMFGVAPCPLTIFTFGLFLFVRTKIAWYLYLIPLLWSLIGMSAAISLKVPQDYALVVSGVIGSTFIVLQNRQLANAHNRRRI
jgi:hypothetical protein